MSEVRGVALLAGGFKVNDADVVIVAIGAPILPLLGQLLLLVVVLQPLLENVLHTSEEREDGSAWASRPVHRQAVTSEGEKNAILRITENWGGCKAPEAPRDSRGTV